MKAIEQPTTPKVVEQHRGPRQVCRVDELMTGERRRSRNEGDDTSREPSTLGADKAAQP